MKLLHNILNRVNVLTADYSTADSYSLHLTECRRRVGGVECGDDGEEIADLADARKKLAACPVVVVVSGYGVITRQVDTSADIVAKVTAADGDFRWTRHGNDISFMREEQLKPLTDALAEINAKVAEVQCAAAIDMQVVKDAVDRYYAEQVNFKTLLKPSAAGSAMAQYAASRLKLPVLGLILLALMINTMVSPGVRAEYETANVKLQALRRTIGQADDVTRRQQELIREYDRTLPMRISFLCDRLAAAVPEGITLRSLAVQPPLRSIENGKKTTFAQDVVEITGEASGAGDVSDYIARLNGLGIATQVRLASMEQDGESGLFGFKIEIEL